MMLRTVRDLKGLKINARDGDIGQVDDFLFEEESWTVRYMVVHTGPWLLGNKVIISPACVAEADWKHQALRVDLTREQVKESPPLESAQPLSRQREAEYATYYGWPMYWGGAGLWGGAMYPGFIAPPPGTREASPEEEEQVARRDAGLPMDREEGNRSFLRAAGEVLGYQLHEQDDELGQVDDLVLDDESWEIRYLVVDTGTWLAGRKVLLPPRWVTGMSWNRQEVCVALDQRVIRDAPEWEPGTPISRDYEERLYRYYEQAPYWEGRSGEARDEPSSSEAFSEAFEDEGDADEGLRVTGRGAG
jgi:uncharacterized protein YrrD